MKRKAALHNLGCKVNSYELESMQQMLEKAGYEIVPFEPGADLYLINTCTVTNIADRKSRQMLHKAKKMNPDALVVATGCYAQAKGKELEKDEAIDLVIGNNKKQELISLLESEWEQRRTTAPEETVPSCLRESVIDISKTREYEELQIDRTEEHTRAFIKVQDGCNQFCTYCIIPFARGRVRSRRKEDVISEVQRLADSGCKEIVLTGIHLSSYGVDLSEEENLLSLIRAVHQVEGIRRIRLGSLEPGIITEEFVTALTELPKVCHHFHLSLQSGCDRTLKAMNRRYTSGEYRERCQILRKHLKDPALTTDVITGFPGETEEDFAASAAFVDETDFFETHIFPYSRREGTKAAAMPDQLPEAVKKQRLHVLEELDRRKRVQYLQRAVGTAGEVLFEEQVSREGVLYWSGYTMEYRRVFLRSEEDLENEIREVHFTGLLGGEGLIGEIRLS
ncbi:MAG: tRNA (N(6)-L-threonylcarbamoyladenosine(37)-C(2))-methylthiotransferase MtaB [Lachnospiraceae bacterium]|nr:tRNA (N(6)-L-threonylcarbamoyladenosine(37)-C(2))-methylthiotransferase MtaB [Lachnospiraceae bacterium]